MVTVCYYFWEEGVIKNWVMDISQVQSLGTFCSWISSNIAGCPTMHTFIHLRIYVYFTSADIYTRTAVRVGFKILLLVHRALNGCAPK